METDSLLTFTISLSLLLLTEKTAWSLYPEIKIQECLSSVQEVYLGT